MPFKITKEERYEIRMSRETFLKFLYFTLICYGKILRENFLGRKTRMVYEGSVF